MVAIYRARPPKHKHEGIKKSDPQVAGFSDILISVPEFS